MDPLANFIDLFIHLDEHLKTLIDTCGGWTYLVIFLIVFCETGLVLTPFLPGDSLLFALGTIAGAGYLNIQWVLILLSAAAILGDSANYAIGHLLAPKVFGQKKIPFLKQKYLERTEKFFVKYGGKTIIIARFVPIIRTFAPFLAGVGAMRYQRFILYNVGGALLWVFLLTLGGYYCGTLNFVKNNFSLVILGIIIISLFPGIIEFLRHRKEKRRSQLRREDPITYNL